MSRVYDYVGPAEIKEACGEAIGVTAILAANDMRAWLAQQDEWDEGHLRLTFVVTRDGVLRVGPRRSEHVACALGMPVLAAGELTVRLEPELEVVEATNQSTGYCPEPDCWEAARSTLVALGIPCLPTLTREYVFRLCPSCGERNLVKDDWFECGDCGYELPTVWNF